MEDLKQKIEDCFTTGVYRKELVGGYHYCTLYEVLDYDHFNFCKWLNRHRAVITPYMEKPKYFCMRDKNG